MKEVKIVKVLRVGTKEICKHSWREATSWRIGTKRCFVRICGKCNRVEECREVGEMKNKKVYFSTSEVAEMLGISKKWLYVLEQNKKIPKAKRDPVSNYRFYTESDIKKIQKIRAKRREK